MTESRQQSNRGGNIRGGASIPGCTNPNALNFNPLATGCPVDNLACCLFEEPLSWDCDNGECYGPAQGTQQSFLFVCANRNDCYHGCIDGPNDDFTNYCNEDFFGILWYNESCCSNDSYPINAEYWDVNNNMNFPTLESAYDENITWEPHDSIFFINCGNDGTECISNDPEWLFGSEAHSRIYSHVYIPTEGYQNAYPVMIGGNSPADSYVKGAGFIFGFVLYESDPDGVYDNYPSPGDRIDMMIYKRSRGLLYRTDNFDGNSGNLIFPKVLDDNDEWKYWPDEFRVVPMTVGNFTKVFPTGGVQIVGCTDPEAYNYNPLAQIQEQGQCNYDFPKYGCTNPACENYDLDADVNDGSCFGCVYDEGPIPDFLDMPIGGCMDPDANNYNPNATFDNGTCEYGLINYVSCSNFTNSIDANRYCQRVLSPTYRCSINEFNERVCLDFIGDVSGDGIVDYVDVCMMASHILQTPIHHPLCNGSVGIVGGNLSSAFMDPILPGMIQFGDTDEDGIITLTDFISVINLFIHTTFQTEVDIQRAIEQIQSILDFSEDIVSRFSRPRTVRRFKKPNRSQGVLSRSQNRKINRR